MKRRNFLKVLGIGALGAPVAVKALSAEKVEAIIKQIEPKEPVVPPALKFDPTPEEPVLWNDLPSRVPFPLKIGNVYRYTGREFRPQEELLETIWLCINGPKNMRNKAPFRSNCYLMQQLSEKNTHGYWLTNQRLQADFTLIGTASEEGTTI